MTADELIDLLSEHTVVLTFTKKNGELRSMCCSIGDREPSQDLLPDHVCVWDLNKDGWRYVDVASTEIKCRFATL